jgi:hypothetical protein
MLLNVNDSNVFKMAKSYSPRIVWILRQVLYLGNMDYQHFDVLFLREDFDFSAEDEDVALELSQIFEGTDMQALVDEVCACEESERRERVKMAAEEEEEQPVEEEEQQVCHAGAASAAEGVDMSWACEY